MSFGKCILTALTLALLPGTAWPDGANCWPITSQWEMCGGNRIQEFDPETAKPVFAAMHDSEFVANSWSTEHPQDIIRLGDRALWRKIKLKLIADLEGMNEDYRSVTRHGIEFIEWSLEVGEEKSVLSTAMIENRGAFVVTVSTEVPDDFDIMAAHDIFMSRARLQSND